MTHLAAMLSDKPFIAIQVTATFLNVGVLGIVIWMLRGQRTELKEMIQSQDRRLDVHERKLESLDRDCVKKEDWLRVSNRTDHKLDKVAEQMSAVRQALIDGGHQLDAK